MNFFLNYRLHKEKEFTHKNLLTQNLKLITEEKPSIKVNNEIDQ